MKSVFALSSVLLLATGALSQFQINTPSNPVVCQPLLITWSGGTSPYFLSVFPGSQPNGAPPVHDFGQVTGTSITWIVNVEPNTSIGLTLRDSTGNTVQSAPFTVQAGTDTSCVGKDPSSSAGGASTPATSGTASTPASPSTTAIIPTNTAISSPAASNTTPSTTRTSAAATSSRPAATSNATVGNAVEFGAAGFIGAIIALLA